MSYFRVTLKDPKNGEILVLKAKDVVDSSLGLSFVSIKNFIYSKNTLVVDPIEEQLQKRFENVKSLHVSIYSIISIEEIGDENRGLKFEKDKSNLIVMPTQN